MYNLKKFGGTFKGIIGECLFKLTKRYVIITKFFNKNKYFDIFADKLSPEEKDFINKNWFSIDALEFDYTKKPRRIVLYEIKTRNKIKNSEFDFPAKMTFSTHKIYQEALSKGFEVKIATVWLLDNWDYEIEFLDFEKSNYSVDKDKKYDNKLFRKE